MGGVSVLSDPKGGDTERVTLARLPDGVIVASAVRDGAGAVADFWIEYANRAAIELIGTTENDLVGRRLLELDHRYGLSHLRQLSHVVATARPYDGSFQRFADGPELGIHATKFADGVVARVRDPSRSLDERGPVGAAARSIDAAPAIGHSVPVPSSSGAAPATVLAATDALLWTESETDVIRLLDELVQRLGGRIVDAESGGPDIVEMDVSLGRGAPRFAAVGARSEERAVLDRYLPSFVESARRAVTLLRRADQLAEEASTDVLTGRAGQRALGRALDHLGSGDAVVMIDLDHFRQLEDALGKYEGDRVRRAFGRMLRDTTLDHARSCRYGGEEFLVVVRSGSDVAGLVSAMRTAWPEYRPHPITFSAGVAIAGPDPSVALAAADRALFGAKRMGRDRTEWAEQEVR
jgi:diguanylate cyclase (GGDEF)-like protein